MNEHQSADNIPYLGSLRRISNPGVFDARRMEAQEVIILCEEDAALGVGARQVFLVFRAKQTRLGRGQHVGPAPP